MPALRQHLDQCGVCREEHDVLLALGQLATRDELPSEDELRRRFDQV